MKILKNRIFLSVLCIVLAGAISFLLLPKFYADKGATVMVLRAAEDIPAGTRIQSKYLAMVEVGKFGLPDAVIKDKTLAEGKIAQTDIAAEFILPLHTFKKIVVSEFDKSELFDLQLSTILRFIVRIHCTWWLPYKSIVRRLLEAGSINQEIYNRLYQIEERRPDGEYYKIGLTTNEHDFKMLNDITQKVGTGAADLEILVRNYEDGIISESQLADDLLLFGKTPEDFGVAFEIDEEDAAELNELFAEGAKNGC